MVRRMVCEHIPATFGFDRVDDIQVLSPMQRGVLGCRNLNAVLQEALNATGRPSSGTDGPSAWATRLCRW